MSKAPAAWSCDERDRKQCRNAHGCHCAEITTLLACRDALASAKAEQIRLSLLVSTLTNERDEARALGRCS